MNNSSEIIERLKEIHKVDTDKQLADIFNLSKTAAYNWRLKETVPYKELFNTALELGVSLEWLLNGTGDKFQGAVSAKFLLIPQYSISASAGSGALVEVEEIHQHLSISREWLKREGIQTENLIGLYAKGDSMEPNISNGDSLIIDRNQSIIGGDGGIYVIRYDGELFVKRVQKRFDGRIAITSDNKEYLSFDISKHELDNLSVIGRVVWTWRKVL